MRYCRDYDMDCTAMEDFEVVACAQYDPSRGTCLYCVTRPVFGKAGASKAAIDVDAKVKKPTRRLR